MRARSTHAGVPCLLAPGGGPRGGGGWIPSASFPSTVSAALQSVTAFLCTWRALAFWGTKRLSTETTCFFPSPAQRCSLCVYNIRIDSLYIYTQPHPHPYPLPTPPPPTYVYREYLSGARHSASFVLDFHKDPIR